MKNKILKNMVRETRTTAEELNLKLLEKVEELTLHLIEQNKKIEKLEKLVSSSKK